MPCVDCHEHQVRAVRLDRENKEAATDLMHAKAQLAHATARLDDAAREARAFIDFVLRHTLPARAKSHGWKVVHDIIQHHPFVKDRPARSSPADQPKET